MSAQGMLVVVRGFLVAGHLVRAATESASLGHLALFLLLAALGSSASRLKSPFRPPDSSLGVEPGKVQTASLRLSLEVMELCFAPFPSIACKHRRITSYEYEFIDR